MQSSTGSLNKKQDLITTEKADRLKEATFSLGQGKLSWDTSSNRHFTGQDEINPQCSRSGQKKLNQMYFPKNLHYVRFTAKKNCNMKEFEMACRNADQIYLNKQNKQKTKD
jgi:hypothetical protein